MAPFLLLTEKLRRVSGGHPLSGSIYPGVTWGLLITTWGRLLRHYLCHTPQSTGPPAVINQSSPSRVSEALLPPVKNWAQSTRAQQLPHKFPTPSPLTSVELSTVEPLGPSKSAAALANPKSFRWRRSDLHWGSRNGDLTQFRWAYTCPAPTCLYLHPALPSQDFPLPDRFWLSATRTCLGPSVTASSMMVEGKVTFTCLPFSWCPWLTPSPAAGNSAQLVEALPGMDILHP